MPPLGIGFIGSGFNARFHMLAFQGVRDANVLGVWSPNAKHAAEGAATARRLDIGQARPYASIGEMVADPAIDAIWLCGSRISRRWLIPSCGDTLNYAASHVKNRWLATSPRPSG